MSGLASSSSCPACLHYALRLPASYYNSSANRLVQSNLKKLVSGRTYTTSSEACTSTSTSNNASISNPFTRSVALTKLSQFRVQALDRLSKRQSDLRGRLNDAGNHINNVTGYGEIDRLKEEVQRRGMSLRSQECRKNCTLGYSHKAVFTDNLFYASLPIRYSCSLYRNDVVYSVIRGFNLDILSSSLHCYPYASYGRTRARARGSTYSRS